MNAYDRIANRPVRACTLERDTEEMGLSMEHYLISIDPSLLHEGHVIINHKLVDRRNYLEIADIWKQIRLHDSEFHGRYLWIAGSAGNIGKG